MLRKILLVFSLSPFLGSFGQDNQMLTFLLNEMTNYRSELNTLKADFRDMQTELANIKTTNADLMQENSLMNSTITGLNSRNSYLEKKIQHNISQLHSELVIVDKSTNVSVMFLQTEYQLLKKRLEATLQNVSLDVEFLKRYLENETKAQLGCCSSVHSMVNDISLSVNGIQSTLNKTEISVESLAAQSKTIAFSATGTQGTQFQLGGIVFPSVTINIGGAYNASTGVFNVPTEGVYLFYITDLSSSNGTQSTPFMVNDNRVGSCRKDQFSVEKLFDCQVILALHAGDQVRTRDFYEGPFHCSSTKFSGWKL